ncbi:alpha/beta fold hydrolase [Microbulbifer sp. TYP-18]|uniref:alpha/beta fold hydrolase n=1 Tax=Microbulbifer sp. TYP-18 TaxID=3230024 RepID=UPI0034C5B36E
MNCYSYPALYIDKIPSFSKPNPESVFHSQWLNLEKSRVRYIRVGNSEAKNTVVLMPDPPNTIEHMEELIKILEKTFQVIAFEGAGFGFSTASLSYSFTIEDNADVIIQLLEKLNIKNAILALTCIAALPALLVANKRPDIVVGLVLGQVPSLNEAKCWAKRVDFKGLIGTPYVGQILLRFLRRRLADTWYKNALLKGADRNLYTNRAVDSFRRGARFSLASAFQALLRDRTPESELIATQNAIVLWGTSDKTHKKTNKSSILSLLPNGKIIELQNCAHFPDIELPKNFAECVVEIAESLSSKNRL